MPTIRLRRAAATLLMSLAVSAPVTAQPTGPIVVRVEIEAPDRSPEWVEREVSAPLEQRLERLPRAIGTTSWSRGGSAELEVHFKGGAGPADLHGAEAVVARWRAARLRETREARLSLAAARFPTPPSASGGTPR